MFMKLVNFELDTQCEQAAVGAAHDVIIWDLRRKEKILTLRGGKQEVTCLAGTGALL